MAAADCRETSGNEGRVKLKPHQMAALLACALLGACRERASQELPPAAGLDLTRALRTAQTWSEVAEIDFSDPAARSSMLQGWSTQEKWGRTDFVWSLGDLSTIRVPWAQDRDMTLELSCWAFLANTLPPQVITVSSNGQEIGEVKLSSTYGPGDHYEFTIPATALVEGANIIGFGYRYTSRPADHINGNSDPRALAVAWDRLRIKGAHDQGEPETRMRNGRRELILPYWAGVDYFLLLQPGSSFEVGDLEGRKRGDRDARLEVTVETQTTPPATQVLQTSDGPADRLIVDLEVEAPKIVRLSLRARPPHNRKNGGLVLVDPIVRGSEPEPDRPMQSATTERSRPTTPTQLPNVIIYVIDALRADHVGCYGYALPTTPNIDAFAADATLFTFALAQSSWTKSTIASVLTGLRPDRHNTNTAEDKLPSAIETLGERVSAAGYETAGITTNGVVAARFGFDQGFDSHLYLQMNRKSKEIHQLSDRLNQEAFKWLDQRDIERPFLLYLHATDPHAPYYPREPFRSRFSAAVPPEAGLHSRVVALTQGRAPAREGVAGQLMALYDAEIAFNDDSFGQLITALRRDNLYDSTMIILLSDHGEEFYDHGRWQHGLTLYSEQLHIPLIVKFPFGRWSGETVSRTAQQIDIMPTILEIVGADVPPEVEGRSLLRYLSAPAADQHSPEVFSYLDMTASRRVESVVFGSMKMIHYLAYDQPRPEIELFDLASDPGETHDLAAQHPILVGYLKSLFKGSRPENAHPEERAVLDEETTAQLEALGYLDR